jgi:hypothetical protein
MAKGVGLRLLSRRGSWVQIPPSAPTISKFSNIKRLCKKDAYTSKLLRGAIMDDRNSIQKAMIIES